MTKRTPDKKPPSEPPAPRPPVPSAIGFLFAAMFGVAMLFNLYWDRNPTVTIFLGSATLLILGIDVGRITGRR